MLFFWGSVPAGFWGSVPASYGPFHQVSTCEKTKFNPLRWFVDKNLL